MTKDQATTTVIVFLMVAFGMWAFAIVLAWLLRRTRSASPVKQSIRNRSARRVRDALGRAAALMQPPWDLVGGEVDQESNFAIFDIPGLSKVTHRVRITVEEEGAGGADVTGQVESTHRPAWIGILLGTFLFVIPLAALGLGLWAWDHAHHAADDAQRRQVLQIIQLMHLLWPPFVLIGVRHQMCTQAPKQIRRFIASLDLIVPADEP